MNKGLWVFVGMILGFWLMIGFSVWIDCGLSWDCVEEMIRKIEAEHMAMVAFS